MSNVLWIEVLKGITNICRPSKSVTIVLQLNMAFEFKVSPGGKHTHDYARSPFATYVSELAQLSPSSAIVPG